MVRTASYQLIAFSCLAALWESLVRWGALDPLFFPPPSAIAEYLHGAILDGTLLSAIGITCSRLGIGFAIGLSLGVPLGFLIAYSTFARATLGVLALGLQALPSVCWVPLALIWFGQTEAAVLFVVVMGTIWSIAIALADGIAHLPPIYERAARTMGASGFSLVWKVIVPASFPMVLNGMKQGWAFAWRSLLAAEIFVTILSGFGLGQLLHYGRELHAMEQVFAIMGIVIALGLVIDLLVFGTAQRMIRERWGLTGSAT